MHPENKKRLESLGDLPVSEIPFDESVLKLIHGDRYIQQVKESCVLGKALDGDTHTSPGSYEAAVYAANATILASERGDMAVVRPPGHHAYPNRASGFCIFNNVAIASQKFVNEGKRVLIFDFDGHLGDGTSEIFYDSDQVMYWSIHQYPAFPGHGSENEIGDDKGKGYTINVPLPPGSSDDIFMDAFRSILPIAKSFDPDVVAISAGFDSHQYD
ncbi:MAG: histone deacetylase, partial [Saprospiraceae bacterium]|nr:histone deacetylase [Saprospiraceae bacterium]